MQQTVAIIYKDKTKDPIRESTVFQLLKKGCWCNIYAMIKHNVVMINDSKDHVTCVNYV